MGRVAGAEIAGAAFMVIVYTWVEIAPRASVIFTVTGVNVPVAVGVPDTTAVLALIVRPVGKPVALQAYGAVPPIEVIVWLG